MRIHHRAIVAIMAGGLVACGPETRPASESTGGSAPTLEIEAARQVVLQNEYAEAFVLTLEPGQSIAPHDGVARVVYSLSDYTIRYTEGTESREAAWRAGDVHVHGAGNHALANTGKTTARMLMVARTTAALARPEAPQESAAAQGQEKAGFLLDDDRFRVSVVALAPGAALPAHSGLPRIVYALSDYAIRYEADGAPAAERSYRAGEAHWHEADRHAVANTGKTEARFLIVQFKR